MFIFNKKNYINNYMYNFIKNNVVGASIILFIVVFSIFIYLKPNFLYDKDGVPRQFGIGKKNTSVVPLWVIALAVAILAYLLVLYFVSKPNTLF